MNTTDRSTFATIILNWNGRPYLEACLSALMAQTYPIARVMLVDNVLHVPAGGDVVPGGAEASDERAKQRHVGDEWSLNNRRRRG